MVTDEDPEFELCEPLDDEPVVEESSEDESSDDPLLPAVPLEREGGQCPGGDPAADHPDAAGACPQALAHEIGVRGRGRSRGHAGKLGAAFERTLGESWEIAESLPPSSASS